MIPVGDDHVACRGAAAAMPAEKTGSRHPGIGSRGKEATGPPANPDPGFDRPCRLWFFLRMNRPAASFAFALAAGLALALAPLSPAQGRADRPAPHMILMVADDLGWEDVGFHGSAIKTPHLDQLAKDGVRLDRFYVQPVCTPTRGALMTGRYPIRLGLQCGVVRPWATHGLPLDEKTLPEGLKSRGYATAIAGKWHLGHHQPAYLPTRRGFDRQYGHYNGAIDYFTHDRDGGTIGTATTVGTTTRDTPRI